MRADVNTSAKEDITTWLVDYLARILETDPAEIDPVVHLGEYGLDSAGAAGLSADLQDWLGVPLKESIAFDHPTIEELSEHVATILSGQVRHD